MNKEYDPNTLKKIQKVELDMLDDLDRLCDKYGIEYFAVGGTTIGCLRHKGFIPWDDDIDLGMMRDDYEKFLLVAEKEYGDRYSILNYRNDKNCPFLTTRWVKNGTVFLEESFKNIPCNFGIFIDLFCFDNVSDNDLKMKIQCFWAWFWSKWMILRSVPEPVLYQRGLTEKMIRMVCRIVNGVLNLLHVDPGVFYRLAEAQAQKCRNENTRRVAFMYDPKPGMSIMYKKDVLPTRKMTYEREGTLIRIQRRMEKYTRFRFGDDFMTLPPEDRRHNHLPYRLDFGEKEE